MAKKKSGATDNRLNVVELSHGDNLFKFLEKSYEEAFSLITFSRDYFNARGRMDKMQLTGEQSIIYTLAMSTITTQLTSVLGWLLMCRAVQEGEVKIEDLKSDDFRMPEFETNMDENDSCFTSLNDTVRGMLQQSSRLYNRIKRMENSIRENLIKTMEETETTV